MNREQKRLLEARTGVAAWKRWGPYLSERQWGTVREDYSADGSAWDYFPHDHARSRAYRWGEDGIAGWSDDRQLLCFSVAMWNGRDPILKERLFGLTGPEGNHGEDVKELYYYLDSTPTHSYARMLYKYPQTEFPYRSLVEGNRARGKGDAELELVDTGSFDGDRYFDVAVEFAKDEPESTLIAITVCNRGPEAASLDLLPQLWFRNTWSWGRVGAKPELMALTLPPGARGRNAVVRADHPELGRFHLHCESVAVTGAPELLFTENETNVERLYSVSRPGSAPQVAGTNGAGAHGANGSDHYYKDAFHEHVIAGRESAVNPELSGTKVAARYRLEVPAGGEVCVRLRLGRERAERPFASFDTIMARRRAEADEFYGDVQRAIASPAERALQRQAFAGMLWSKQFYYYDVAEWLTGDPGQPAPPATRNGKRNGDWFHLNNADVVSMPDKWEYPWYAAWDLAFHCVPLAMVDPDFAKEQLLLLTREWYMHPNGQLPAYEWAFSDVNPPVHAWGTWRVYEIDRAKNGGKGDLVFLERVFHKLLLNFTWWVNRKDVEGRNVFQGGFLGLDNIGVFDRSASLPTGGHLDQADGTSWMAVYSLTLMRIALELARTNRCYEDVATKFFEHFLYIAAAMNNLGNQGIELWNEEDGFFYDVLHSEDMGSRPLKVRSMVGLIPLYAVEILEPELLAAVPDFAARMEWFLEHRPDLAGLVSRWQEPGRGEVRLLSLLRAQRMKRVLKRMLDEQEFLSDYGVRALSRHHLDHPYRLELGDREWSVGYRPGESDTGLFGGNSNWRGPIWFPVNYLIIESLQKFHRYYGADWKVELPTGSGRMLSLAEVAEDLASRLARIFLPDASGRRPVFGGSPRLQDDPHFRDHLLFFEYFHGDTGRGVGASHQTGWTGLIAELLHSRGAAWMANKETS